MYFSIQYALSARTISSPSVSPPELQIRQQKGILNSSALLLAVDDPTPNVGSGSAALNALICVAEYLAAQEGQKVGSVLYTRPTITNYEGSALNPKWVQTTKLTVFDPSI